MILRLYNISLVVLRISDTCVLWLSMWFLCYSSASFSCDSWSVWLLGRCWSTVAFCLALKNMIDFIQLPCGCRNVASSCTSGSWACVSVARCTSSTARPPPTTSRSTTSSEGWPAQVRHCHFMKDEVLVQSNPSCETAEKSAKMVMKGGVVCGHLHGNMQGKFQKKVVVKEGLSCIRLVFHYEFHCCNNCVLVIILVSCIVHAWASFWYGTSFLMLCSFSGFALMQWHCTVERWRKGNRNEDFLYRDMHEQFCLKTAFKGRAVPWA